MYDFGHFCLLHQTQAKTLLLVSSAGLKNEDDNVDMFLNSESKKWEPKGGSGASPLTCPHSQVPQTDLQSDCLSIFTLSNRIPKQQTSTHPENHDWSLTHRNDGLGDSPSQLCNIHMMDIQHHFNKLGDFFWKASVLGEKHVLRKNCDTTLSQCMVSVLGLHC